MDLNPEPSLAAAEARRVVPAIAVAENGNFFGPGAASGPRKVAERGVDLNRLFGHNDAAGNEIRKFEQPWQRNAAYMIASGRYSLKAVAAACDKGYDAVRALLKNAWFQETVAAIQRENGAGDLMELFKAETMSSLATIVELRDDAKAPASVRRACAMDIIAQVYGKPTQKVEMETSTASDDPVAEVARLEAENARLKGCGSADSRSEMTSAASREMTITQPSEVQPNPSSDEAQSVPSPAVVAGRAAVEAYPRP